MASASLIATVLTPQQLSLIEKNRAAAIQRKQARLDGLWLDAGRTVLLSDQQKESIAASRAEAIKRKYQATRSNSVHGGAGIAGLSTDQKERMESNRLRALHRRQAKLDSTTALTIPLPPPGWSAAQVPAKPQDLAEIIHNLPEMTLLSTCHPHPRDAHLTFVASSHTYYVDGVATAGSVTGLIHAFCQAFNSGEIIHKMRTGRNWPRPGYFRSVPVMLELLKSIAETEQLREVLERATLDEEVFCEMVKDWWFTISVASVDIIDVVSLSNEEITTKWKANADAAANEGTWMHFKFEAYLNRAVIEEHTTEVQMFLRYIATLKGVTAYRTEWTIFGEEERLAGSIDFVAKMPNGDLVLFDWKRSKLLRTKYSNKFQSMKGPLMHLEDCQGNHYRLQLNCYKYILEKYYGQIIASMHVVCCHPDNGECAFVDDVPVMKSEAEAMMSYQRQRAARITGGHEQRSVSSHE